MLLCGMIITVVESAIILSAEMILNLTTTYINECSFCLNVQKTFI